MCVCVLCFPLARVAQGGKGFSGRDPARALLFLVKACDAGFAPSCRNLSVMYARGDGVAVSEDKARLYFRRTADLFEAQTGQKAPIAPSPPPPRPPPK